MEMETEQIMTFLQLFEKKMMAMLDARHKSIMTSLGLTEAKTAKNIEQDSGMMQSVEEHQEIPTEDVAVMPVRGLRKRRRNRKLTGRRRGEPKELIRGDCGSHRKLAAACRKNVSRHATVAWQKINLTRNIRIQESRESPKEFAAAGMRKSPEGNNGIKGWSARQRSYLGSGGTPSKSPYEIFGRKIAKQVVGTSSGLQRIRKWTIWRGRPPPKRKKTS
jgi:hypothetical protein